MRLPTWRNLAFVTVIAIIAVAAKRDVSALEHYYGKCSLDLTSSGGGGACATPEGWADDEDSTTWACGGSCACYCDYFILDYECGNLTQRVCFANGTYDYCTPRWQDCWEYPCCEDGDICGGENYCIPAMLP